MKHLALCMKEKKSCTQVLNNWNSLHWLIKFVPSNKHSVHQGWMQKPTILPPSPTSKRIKKCTLLYCKAFITFIKYEWQREQPALWGISTFCMNSHKYDSSCSQARIIERRTSWWTLTFWKLEKLRVGRNGTDKTDWITTVRHFCMHSTYVLCSNSELTCRHPQEILNIKADFCCFDTLRDYASFFCRYTVYYKR